MRSTGTVSQLEEVGTKISAGKPEDTDVKVAQVHEYDVIVIGGGTSGCALASRLSEDKSIRVLLLEAGKSGVTIPATRIPAGFLNILRTDDCFNFYTEPQTEAGGGRKYWPRGKMLGGCSSINAMMFQVGAPSDFDEWAKLGGPGAEAWKWSEIQKYFRKFENYIPSKRFPNVDPSLRGSNGPMEIGYSGNFSKVSEKFLEACAEVGIPYIPDINTSAGCIGSSKIMTYMTSKGRRVSTETAYLTPEVLARPNLTVAIEATVTRVVFDTSGELPRASAVEFTRTKDGPRYRAGARREVAICGGALCSPMILMHSGIGPSSELTKHNIPVLVDLSGVGQHLLDHPLVQARFRAKPACESISFLASRTLMEKARSVAAALQYQIFGTGPLTCNLGETVAFVRSDNPKLFPVEEGYGPIEDSTSGPDAPDIELLSTPAAWMDHGFEGLPPGQLFSITGYLLRPTSRGTLTLRSADPFDAPIIDPKYLSTRHDIDVLVRGLKLIAKMMKTQPLASMVAPDNNPALDQDLHEADDATLERIVRERVETIYHPTSTARMGKREDGGVVDAELRVFGVGGLRVCDASIFPGIISGHTSAACIATAEKAADIIKAALSK